MSSFGTKREFNWSATVKEYNQGGMERKGIKQGKIKLYCQALASPTKIDQTSYILLF